MSRDMPGNGRRRSLLAGLVLSFVVLSTGAEAQSRGRLSALDMLFVIGLGEAFIANLNQEGTCRDFNERAASAGIGATFGLVGGVGGMLLGGLAGSEGGSMWGMGAGAGLGALLGRGLGRELGKEIGQAAGAAGGRVVGRAAERGMRDYADEYAFELCRLVLASDALKAPLVRRYLQLGQSVCGLDPEQMQRMGNGDWNRLIDCNNGQNDEARDVLLQAMRINQATCYAIEALNKAIVREEADAALARREGSVMPFVPITEPSCDARSPAEMWQSYLRGRL